MSNKSVLGSPNNVHQGSRTAYPVSQGFTFTASSGMLLPVSRSFLNIGEKISGVPQFFMRTDPLLAPAMADVDVYVDTFFVPMRHIIGMFENWFTQVSDAPSDLWEESNFGMNLPVVRTADDTNPFGWMTETIFNFDVFQRNADSLHVSSMSDTFGFGAHRLTMHLGYNPQSLFYNVRSQISEGTLDATPFCGDYHFAEIVQNTYSPALPTYFYGAYQKIYMDVYRDSEFEENNVKAYNFDSYFNSGNLIVDPTANVSSITQLSDAPRLGIFQLRYRNRAKDYFTAVHPSPLFNSIGMLPNALEHLSVVKNWLDSAGDDAYTIGNDGLTVNAGLSSSGLISPADPSVFASSPSSPAFQYLNTEAHPEGYFLTGPSEEGPFVPLEARTSGNLELAQLRSAFALDKLLRVTNRAGRHADDQILAQFGVKIPQGISNEVYKIKSYHTMVHFGEVVSTAQTEITDGQTTQVTPLGEMAGRGVALLNSNESFSFTAPCHGIFMAILSVSPRYKYVGAVEKDGLKVNLSDFFRPQTDNLGQQPMWFGEGGQLAIPFTDETTEQTPAQRYNHLSGWQWHYMEDKIKFDKCSYVFMTNGKNPWSACYPAPMWTDVFMEVQKKYFNKIRPNDLDKLFVAEYAGNASYPTEEMPYNLFITHYLRDPFTFDFNLKCTKISEMSRFSEPSLGGI